MRQVLSLGVGALARCAQPRVGAVGGLLRGGQSAALMRGDQRLARAVVALVGEYDQPGGGQLAPDAPDSGRGQVVHRAWQRSGDPQGVIVRASDDLQVHAVFLVLAGVGRPVGGHAVDGD